MIVLFQVRSNHEKTFGKALAQAMNHASFNPIGLLNIIILIIHTPFISYVHASNKREPFNLDSMAGEMESAESSSTVLCSTMEALSQDCLILILEFLSNTTDFDWFRLSSHRNYAVYGAFLRVQFQGFNVLFEGTTRQELIRSWMDIESGIPMIPSLYFSFINSFDECYRGCTGYVTLHRYHYNSGKSIIRGITSDYHFPFLSILLQSTHVNGTGTNNLETILLCLFQNGRFRQILLYDELGRPRIVQLGLDDLDNLLSGGSIKYRGPKRDRWLQGYWRLLNESALLDAPLEDCSNAESVNHDDHVFTCTITCIDRNGTCGPVITRVLAVTLMAALTLITLLLLTTVKM